MKRIIVPVDFSDYTNYVAKYAVDIAAQTGGEIMFYHAYLDPTLGAPVPTYDFGTYQDTYSNIIEDTEKTEIEKLQTISNQLQKELKKRKIDNVKLSYTLESGFPEEEIIAYSARESADLIILGTHGNGGLMRDLFGSVTEKVVENANIPVMVIPEKCKCTGVRNILFATDFRQTDINIIKKLEMIFSPIDINIHCVHICFGEKEIKDLREMAGLRAKLRKESSKKTFNFIIIESDGIIHGLENYLENQQIDIIALTTHKRNIFTKYLNPSFTKRFIFQSKTPLMVFHG